MNITIEQLRFAVLQCTPGAPASYADRLWQELTRVCECDAGGNVPHRRHDWCRPGGGPGTRNTGQEKHHDTHR
jgi:hypothetical protein